MGVAAVLAAFAAQACDDVPFRWTPGQIELQVSVNGGAPVWFILDSGAEYSIVSTALAKELGLKTSYRLGRDFANEVTLRFGPVTLANQTVMVMPLDNFKAQRRDIRGLIGYDLFARYVVTIDYAKKIVRVCNPKTYKRNPRAAVLQLDFSGRLAVVRVNLSVKEYQTISLRATLDTGAQAPLVIRYPFAFAQGLLPTTLRALPQATVQGPLTFARIPARSITLGRRTFPFETVSAFATPRGSGGSADTDALIGNDLLRNFRVTFDYSRKVLLLEDQ